MPRVYLSSTFEDLKAHREAAAKSIRRCRFDLCAMEDYTATSSKPAAVCVEDVARCDLYIGLFAFRYGFIPPGETLAITEQEYLTACRHNLDLLVFLVDPKHPWEARWRDQGPAGERIAALRERLRLDLMVDFFTTPDDLAAKVASALANYRQGQGQKAVGPLGLAAGQCGGCKYIHPDWQTRLVCDRCGDTLREPCPGCGQLNGIWSRHCGRCGVAIPDEIDRVLDDLKATFERANALVRAGDLEQALEMLSAVRLPGHSRLTKHRDRLERERIRLDRALREQAQRRQDQQGEQDRQAFDRYADAEDWLAALASLRKLEAARPDDPDRGACRQRLAAGLRERLERSPEEVELRQAYLEVRPASLERADERAGEALQQRLLWWRLAPLLCLAVLLVPLLLVSGVRGRVLDLGAPRRFRQFGPLPAAALELSDQEIRRRYLGERGTGRFHDGYSPLRG